MELEVSLLLGSEFSENKISNNFRNHSVSRYY